MISTGVGDVMTSKELKEEIKQLVDQIGPIQAKVSELAAQLMVVTKEEMRHEALRAKTHQ